jgi:hypothetical protein
MPPSLLNTSQVMRLPTCSGHLENGTKYWLKGLYFDDPDVDVSTLTNTELNEVLNPKGDLYRDYINFVYDDSTWSYCDGFDSWFDS